MKKIKFISAIALTLALGACDNYDLPNPPGQTNTDPAGFFETSDLVIAPADGNISLEAANAANKYPVVATITNLANFPEGYDLVVDMEVGSDAAFNKVVTLATVLEGDDITVNPDLLNGAIQDVMTRKPGTYDVNTRFVAYATRGTTRMRLGGENYSFGAGSLDVTTLEYSKVIEDAYYFVPCDANGKPQFGQALKMENTAGNSVSPYDNPEFAVKLDVPAVGYNWAIAPASALTAGANATVYYCNPADEEGMSGKLGTSYAVGSMPINGSVLVTVNMELDSYTLNYAFEVLYPFSGSTAVDKLMLLYTTNYINYSGVTAINRLWTLGAQPEKNGDIIFKADPNSEPVVSEDGLVMTGNISQEGASQIPAPAKKNSLYWADVNLVQKTFSLSTIESISVVGAHNGWNETAEEVVDNNDKKAPAAALTPSRDLRTWTITDLELDGEFKFNCNYDWTLDFGVQGEQMPGSSAVYVTLKGGNISMEKGKYDITLDFSSLPYTATFTKK